MVCFVGVCVDECEHACLLDQSNPGQASLTVKVTDSEELNCELCMHTDTTGGVIVVWWRRRCLYRDYFLEGTKNWKLEKQWRLAFSMSY
jgi:hypothetical protein